MLTSHSFSLNTGKVKLLQDHKVAFLDGPGLCVWDTQSGEKQHLWSNKYGFSSFDANPRRDLLVVAEYGLNPAIYLYNAKLELLHTFEDVCELDVDEVFIDWNGSAFFVVTGCPSYDIRMCDIREKQM